MESKQLAAVVVVPAEFQELHRRVAEWRSTRPHVSRMPEPLWLLATRLARQHGLARVARFARLDYYTLKKRMEGPAPTRVADSDRPPTFIELPPLSAAGVSECTIEVEHPRGSRMRIQVKSAALPDIAGITRAFWGMKR